ncbi:hypothetical protein TNCV_1214751 [Trichonephila clavipes]|nr:hypothetical protein TNCV_1214751 [Trichonephila clavipes]
MTQFSSHPARLRNPPNDATAYMLATHMVSFVRLFAETLAEEYVAVGYLYELVPTSREDDCFGVIGKVPAFVRNGGYPERTFLPSKTRGHGTTPLRVKEDIEGSSSEQWGLKIALLG